jgi:hypothetical protein
MSAFDQKIFFYVGDDLDRRARLRPRRHATTECVPARRLQAVIVACLRDNAAGLSVARRAASSID